MYLKKLARRFMGPEDEGSGGGSAADRGDEWTSTDDDDTAAAALGKPAADEEPPPKVEKESALKPKDEKVEKVEKEETDEEGKAKAKDSRIPAARHKEILDKERGRREAVETELAKYKQGGQIANVNAEITAAETSLIALEREYAKQLTDGEPDKAAATMTQIRRTERAINEKTSEMRETAATARAVEQVRFDTTVDRLEALYPALNVDHDDFDKAKTGEVLELKEAYQLKGYTPSAALQKAVKLLMPPETKRQEEALKTEPRVDAKAIEAARKAAAVEKTTDAVSKTPASTAKVGLDSDKSGGGAVTAKDALKMPYSDFIKLDEATLATMRGDTL